MRQITFAVASIALLTASTAAFAAGPCKDAKGKFIKCPTAAAATATGGILKDKNGKCHVASGPKKGQFTKCP
ncbi:hypothetical protein [Sphingomonas kyeonggiensis]|uniref:DUF2282 domain-containing protein n=1 Tax=Sphingomonas kyeonggiensis TaxID=1268553 RepID=A0A7W6JWD8_9SPHN|nr:hypothetical protein [Sphingomonas kyeonggiensis]MBB4100750.1 hypothetical protein [Sphingomonas kyeonggiensis]